MANNEEIKNVYVLLRPSGTRLGNWMFQYASAKTAFPGAKIRFLIRNRDEWGEVERRKELFAGVEIVDRAPPGALIRRQLYQDSKFVAPSVVRECFSCPPRVETFLRHRYGALLEKSGLVSIHVRRGDYLGLPHRHPFVGEAYLKKAVAHLVAKVGKPTFVVCSDDLPWCRRFFNRRRFPGLDFHFAAEDGGVMGDLFLMTKCRHHICSNSTFSWWGAYLGVSGIASGEAVTVFPSLWFGLKLRHLPWKGLYFPGSTVMVNHYTPLRWLHAVLIMFKNSVGDLLRALGLRKRLPVEPLGDEE